MGLAKDKLLYYQFLNKLFPSNYSKSKINNIKRQRLFNSSKIKNSYQEYDDTNEENSLLSNQIIDYNGIKKLLNSDTNKNINIIFNMKPGKNNIYNYENNT